MEPTKKKIICNPADKELMENVISSACSYFEISENDLLQGREMIIINTRYLCFYLIMKNTCLKDYIVSNRFNKHRATVNYGVEIIEVHKNIYKQTLSNMNSIATIANKFEKKYPWHIQQINTTRS